MSSTQRRNFGRNPVVIVRAFGEEPVRLVARCVFGAAIEVVGDDPNVPGYFLPTSVYSFDEELYCGLRSAFEKNDHKRLRDLWRAASKFNADAEFQH